MSTLLPQQFVVIGDFSENYSFVLQDAAQGFHWNNSQATIHPFVAYYRESGKLEHVSYVIISDCLHHDTIAVHLFQKNLVQFLQEKFSKVDKILYFSDGSAAQYKNRKKFVNLCYHKEDFGVQAEWHFYATSHGKGPCDGIGGTVKCLAARASLQRAYHSQIMTPHQLFDWAIENIEKVHFKYCTSDDYRQEEIFLEERLKISRTIPGTQKLHCFIPQSNAKILTKMFSNSSVAKQERVTRLSKTEIAIDEIEGFVTAVYENEWWLGCVIQVNQDDKIVSINILISHGPSQSYKYPAEERVIMVSTDDILTKVDPRTSYGRICTISKEETKAAIQQLKYISKTSN